MINKLHTICEQGGVCKFFCVNLKKVVIFSYLEQKNPRFWLVMGTIGREGIRIFWGLIKIGCFLTVRFLMLKSGENCCEIRGGGS